MELHQDRAHRPCTSSHNCISPVSCAVNASQTQSFQLPPPDMIQSCCAGLLWDRLSSHAARRGQHTQTWPAVCASSCFFSEQSHRPFISVPILLSALC